MVMLAATSREPSVPADGQGETRLPRLRAQENTTRLPRGWLCSLLQPRAQGPGKKCHGLVPWMLALPATPFISVNLHGTRPWHRRPRFGPRLAHSVKTTEQVRGIEPVFFQNFPPGEKTLGEIKCLSASSLCFGIRVF